MLTCFPTPNPRDNLTFLQAPPACSPPFIYQLHNQQYNPYPATAFPPQLQSNPGLQLGPQDIIGHYPVAAPPTVQLMCGGLQQQPEFNTERNYTQPPVQPYYSADNRGTSTPAACTEANWPQQPSAQVSGYCFPDGEEEEERPQPHLPESPVEEDALPPPHSMRELPRRPHQHHRHCRHYRKKKYGRDAIYSDSSKRDHLDEVVAESARQMNFTRSEEAGLKMDLYRNYIRSYDSLKDAIDKNLLEWLHPIILEVLTIQASNLNETLEAEGNEYSF